MLRRGTLWETGWKSRKLPGVFIFEALEKVKAYLIGIKGIK